MNVSRWDELPEYREPFRDCNNWEEPMGKIITTDILIVGAGVAGLRAACEVS